MVIKLLTVILVQLVHFLIRLMTILMNKKFLYFKNQVINLNNLNRPKLINLINKKFVVTTISNKILNNLRIDK